MTRRAPFTAAAEASKFLNVYFDKVSAIQNGDGVTCALPGVFSLKHIPLKTQSGRFLRTIHELSVDAPDQDTGMVLLGNQVNQESVILRHFSKPCDQYQPDTDAHYVVIDRGDRLHQHGHAGYIDFNMAVFADGELELGSMSGDALDPYWHVHLALAADIST